jgi:putative integral membrane protein (TIGR02587 family)
MAFSRRHQAQKRQVSLLKRELDDLVRGICGAFLFGAPLLYTMEVWWVGSSASPPWLLLALLLTLFTVYLINRTEGFRKIHSHREGEAIANAIEAVAIGLICAAITLIVLRQITAQTNLSGAVGQIVFESVPFSLGVALANQFLGNSADAAPESSQPGSSQSKAADAPEHFFEDDDLNETIADTGATLVGAMVIAISIAPTDEVIVLVAAVEDSWLILIVMVSLLLSYCIVFQANFTQQGQRRLHQGWFQKPLSETLFAYLVSLAAAALMLVFFKQIDLNTPWDLAFREILILGFPATLGGAAGRLAL